MSVYVHQTVVKLMLGEHAILLAPYTVAPSNINCARYESSEYIYKHAEQFERRNENTNTHSNTDREPK